MKSEEEIMNDESLKAISPIDGRYYSNLKILRDFCSESTLMKNRLFIEIEWFKELILNSEINKRSIIEPEDIKYLDNIAINFNSEDMREIKKIENEIKHDVKAVEYFIKRKITAQINLAKMKELVHFGLTSEDVNNLAYALMIKNINDLIFIPKLDALRAELLKRAQKYSNTVMLARTHGQPATPTTMGKEFANFTMRLRMLIQKLTTIEFCGKLNGAVGNYNSFIFALPNIDWLDIAEKFVTKLALKWSKYTTQIEPRDYMAEFFHLMIRINVVLLNLTEDLWFYISLNYFKQKAVAGEVGSSVMPNKINPIDFENGEGNLGLANALFNFLAMKLPKSRMQRDLSDSTVLRNISVALAHTYLAIDNISKGLKQLTINSQVMHDELNNHWEVIVEGLQTILRLYDLEQPYEKLKELTRGQKVSQEKIRSFIDTIDIPKEIKERMQELTPLTYLGLAKFLAENVE